jgi:two-component system, NtrC family, nitrogen regulation sensor histidine kinase GlnL
MTLIADTTARVYDNLATAVLLFDDQLKLTCINAAGENLLHVSNRQMTGQKSSEILADSHIFNEVLKRTKETHIPFTERGMVLQLPYKEEITVDCCVTPVIEDDVCVELIVELTDSHAFQRVMQDESLHVLHDASREAVRGMAHEIRNPLGGIRGAAQLLQGELKDKDLIEYTSIIIQEADRLRNFVDRMLASDQKLDCVALNIYEVIEYVCSLLKVEFETCPDFVRDYDPSLPAIMGDREQLIQVFLNVMRNALQATECRGQICLQTRVIRQFTIRQITHRMIVRIDIIDDGPGIPAEIEKNVFYPMITGRADGTGLGLSIAQSLVNLHGGVINQERKDEKTIFSIYLPMSED